MRKGLFFPYGCTMLPIASTMMIAQLFFFPLSGTIGFWFLQLWNLLMMIGLIESIYAYDVIKDARAASVQPMKNVMRIGFSIFVVSLAFWLGPWLIGRAFSVETSSAGQIGWIGRGVLLLSAFPIGAASVIVLDRWSSSYPEELEIPYWTTPSRRELIYLIGWSVMVSGFLLVTWVPAVALVLLSTGVVLLLVGSVLNRRPKAQPEEGRKALPSKIELRKVGYEEKLATARQVCELVRRKLPRRVLAVCMPGDGAENSQYPYGGIYIVVVVRDGINLPREHYVFDGIMVRIDYWQEIAILHRAKSFDDSWPWYSDSYRRRIVLYEKKQWFRKLDRAAEQSDAAKPTDAIRDSALHLLQNLADVRDNQTRGDSVGVRIDCWHAGWTAISLVYLINRKYTKTDYWKDVFECAVQPSNFRPRLETMLGFESTSQEIMVESTESVCEELLEMVRSRGIAIASSKLRA